MVPAAKPFDEEAWAERKRLKSLRNQRNRIVNRLKRDATTDDPELQKYLPVHLRNLPEPPGRKGKKESAESSPQISQHSDEQGGSDWRQNHSRSRERPSEHNGAMQRDSIFQGDQRNNRKRSAPEDSSQDCNKKRARPQPSQQTQGAAATGAVDQQAVTVGKDWQQVS